MIPLISPENDKKTKVQLFSGGGMGGGGGGGVKKFTEISSYIPDFSQRIFQEDYFQNFTEISRILLDCKTISQLRIKV